MSSAEEFNLRWNNHLNTISQLLGEFLNNKSLCDVTLSAEGQTISCHRVILAACSTYFQGIFNQVNDKALVVMVKDAKFIDLKSLVDFMYYGEVSVEHDRLNSLLRTAESLKVKGLADEKKKEERILSEPPMPVNVPQPAAVPQKRVMPPMDSMAKRQRVSAPAFAHSPRPSSASIPSPRVEGGVSQDGVQPKQELVDLEGDENDTGDQQSYLEGDDDSNLSGAGPSSSGMEGLDESGQMEGVEGQDGSEDKERKARKSQSSSCTSEESSSPILVLNAAGESSNDRGALKDKGRVVEVKSSGKSPTSPLSSLDSWEEGHEIEGQSSSTDSSSSSPTMRIEDDCAKNVSEVVRIEDDCAKNVSEPKQSENLSSSSGVHSTIHDDHDDVEEISVISSKEPTAPRRRTLLSPPYSKLNPFPHEMNRALRHPIRNSSAADNCTPSPSSSSPSSRLLPTAEDMSPHPNQRFCTRCQLTFPSPSLLTNHIIRGMCAARRRL